MSKYISIILFLSSAMINAEGIRVHNASSAALYYAKKKWEVEKDGQRKEIANWCVDKIARGIPEDKIEEFLKYVALKVSELDNGEYALKAHARGLGGGPVTAAAFSWITRATCWAGIGATVATAATTAAPLIASGATAFGASSATATAIGGGVAAAGAASGEIVVVGATAGGSAVTAGTITAAGLAGAGSTAAAAEGTMAVATVTGFGANVVGLIEAASTAAFAIGMALPTP